MAPMIKLSAALCLCTGAWAQDYWSMTSGFWCEVDDEGCATIGQIVGDYAPLEICTFSINEAAWSDCHAISVDYFDVDSCDYLEVNGVYYWNDDSGPDGVVPTGAITWNGISGAPTGAGFRLCVEDTCATGAGSSGSTTDDSSSNSSISSSSVGIVILLVACVLLVLLAAMAFWAWKRKRSARPSDAVPATVVGGGGSPPAPPALPQSNTFVKQCVRVGTVPPADAAVPYYWDNKARSSEFNGMVDVSKQDTDAIQQMLSTTFKPVKTKDRRDAPMPKSLKVVKVKRNENIKLWQRYTAGRNGVATAHTHKCVSVDDKAYGGRIVTFDSLPLAIKKDLKPRVNEVYLWHGTNPDAADSICKTGFDMARAGSATGMMYGAGTYFAECSSKSDEYASSGNGGIYQDKCCLLLCRVVLGEVHMLTIGGEKVHSTVKASMESGQFDSILGNREAAVGTYREFVVYQEDQIYPEFMVIYERQ